MQFDWVTFGFQFANVIILLAILRHFLFRPVARIIAERQQQTDQVLAEAEADKAEAQKAKARAAGLQAEIAASRLDVVEKARKDAEAERARLIADARDEAQAVLDKAEADAAKMAQNAALAQEKRAAELAVAITEKLLDTLPDEARVMGYPARLKAAIEAATDEEKEALRASETLCLVAPRKLSAPEARKAREAVAALNTQELPIELDPSLLAGLELRADHAVLHNSLRYDLTRIAQALSTHAQD